MTICLNEFRNYIQYKDKIIECDNLEKLLIFLKESELFKEIMLDSLKEIKKKNKYKDIKEILLKDLKLPTHLSEFNLIKPEDIAFSRLMLFIENSYGNILLKRSTLTYSNILDMQYTIKTIEKYISEKGLSSFTSQQHNEAKRLEKEFKKELPIFKSYIDCILYNNDK